jgi:hypothetical protein
MSWAPMIVDKRGWNDLMAILLRAMEEALEVHNESAERLIAEDAEGVSCTVSLMGYPSAIENRKVGLPADAKQLGELIQGETSMGARKSRKATGKSKSASKGRGGKAASKGKRKGKKS